MRQLRPWLVGGALCLGAATLGAGTAVTPAASVQEASPWINDYEAAKAAARQSGKPIFLVFR